MDYLLESVSATIVALTGLGRFVQDLLLWGMREFGYVRFGDGFVQASSIMPQKRNPVAIEHARAIGSKALGQAQAIVTAVHNTPFGDIVDTEDDLQPLVSSMFRDAVRAFRLVAAAIQTAEFDAVRLEARAGEGGTTSTELADTLAREHDVPFKTAHTIAVKALKAQAREPAGRSGVGARGRVLPDARPSVAVHEGRPAADPQPAVFRGGANDARRPCARGDRPRARGVSRR